GERAPHVDGEVAIAVVLQPAQEAALGLLVVAAVSHQMVLFSSTAYSYCVMNGHEREPVAAGNMGSAAGGWQARRRSGGGSSRWSSGYGVQVGAAPRGRKSFSCGGIWCRSARMSGAEGGIGLLSATRNP